LSKKPNNTNIFGAKNTLYPYLKDIRPATTKEELKEFFSKDYVMATYKDNKRCNDNFISSDCLALDCENDHSEDLSSWITIQDVMDFFPVEKIHQIKSYI